MTTASVQVVTPEEAYQARSTARLIDVREPHELRGELGHIPGVESVPLATIEREAATWDRNTTLVMVCRSGGRSGRAADLLVRLGFPHVMNMTGGMQAYRAAGLPVEQGTESVMSKLFPRNEANFERVARVALGLGVLSLMFWGPESRWGLLGIVPLVTGAVGSCPLYTVLGVSTCSRRAHAVSQSTTAVDSMRA